MRALSTKALLVLMMTAFLIAPFRFGALQAQAISLDPTSLIPADKLLPKGLISEENREELEKSFKKGVAACAIMTYIMNVINTGSFKVPVEDFATVLKDNFIDCVMYHVINVLIEDMLRSLTKWVQGGFKGNPVFVTRLNGHMQKLADQVAGEFIETYAPFLCSPFRAEIRLQLLLAYKESRGDNYNPSCTFTGSMENVQRFLDGDFASGGWERWFETYSNPYNTPYGAYMESVNELSARIDAATGEAELDITLGNGFLSRKRQTCYSVLNEDGSMTQAYTLGDNETSAQAMERQGVTVTEYGSYCDKPEIVTPGSFIEEQINEKYGSPGRRLEMADEMNELINAVILFLVGNIFKDEDGLSGYSFKDVGPVDLLDPTIDDSVPGNDSTPDDSEQPGPAGASMCFSKNGVFLVPTHGGTLTAGFKLTPPKNTSYDRIELEFDITNNGWPEDREGWPAEVFWFGRPNNHNMFGYSKVGAPGGGNGEVFMLAHGIGLDHAFKTRIKSKLNFPEGSTYHFRYIYDAKAGKITLQAINKANGNVVKTLTGVPTVPGINVGNEVFNLGFGYSETEANPKERPMYGWEYSNLKASFISGDDRPTDCTTPSPGGSVDKPSDGDDGGGGGGTGDDDPDNPYD